MSLYIKSMNLESFKSYENVTITFNKNFNVIIGENNVGKTTIFEAMLLWKKCYDLQIKSNMKEFYKDSNNIYVNFEDLHFMRLSQDTDIFKGNKTKCKIILELFDSTSGNSFNLGFILAKPHNIPNSYIRSTMVDEGEFRNFQQFYNAQKLNNIMYFHQTKPVSSVLNKEPYMYQGQVIKKIEKGKSNEVLRNKIIESINSNKDRLEKYMKSVLGINFSFVLPSKARKTRDEYIDLKVDINDEQLDIFLQGSGFLQVAEIFSTIDVLENALNVLLIDEPDSHINARIQEKLLGELKNINNTQVFVISHNDNFVSNLDDNELIFINSRNKETGLIEPLKEIDFDKIHNSMGGIISSLTQLNISKKIVFVEGKDDIDYIKLLYKKIKHYVNLDNEFIDFKNIAFCYIRGKDYLKIKLENYKNMLLQLIPDRELSVIFDKDFCTLRAQEEFVNTIKGTKNKFKCFTHNGYCIESVLFSDDDILSRFLQKISSINKEIIKSYIDDYKETIKNSLANVSSEKYKSMKCKFTGQKKSSRTELERVEFDQFAEESSKEYNFAMNKENIKEFILYIENKIDKKLFEREDETEETYASNLLKLYIENIENIEDIYSGYKDLIEFVVKK